MYKYRNLKDFLSFLKNKKRLKIISHEVDPYLEMTEISSRTFKLNGPALLFKNPKGFSIPVLCNLFGTVERIVFGFGKKNLNDLKKIGEFLSFFKDPVPPVKYSDIFKNILNFRRVFSMPIKEVKKASCQEKIFKENQINLYELPIMHCWPKDVSKLITWGLTVTKSPKGIRQNLGIYRQQVLNEKQLIIRWFPNRGGALDFENWKNKYPNEKFPVSIIIGSDPITTLSAAMPIPNTISEYSFFGLLSGKRLKVVRCISNKLKVPANSEIILEGYIDPKSPELDEGPFGDHTGYYGEVKKFPVLTITTITRKNNPIYHSTYTGRPPDEVSTIGFALNEILIPIIKKQHPEILDFYLPPEACSYKMAIVTIQKQYAGHARHVMMSIWSYLKQFIYTKFIIICDQNVNARDWNDVIWAITTKIDPRRDIFIIDNTPADPIDFSSLNFKLGSKIGLDATNKFFEETNRKWGEEIVMSKDIKKKIDCIWEELNILMV